LRIYSKINDTGHIIEGRKKKIRKVEKIDSYSNKETGLHKIQHKNSLENEYIEKLPRMPNVLNDSHMVLPKIYLNNLKKELKSQRETGSMPQSRIKNESFANNSNVLKKKHNKKLESLTKEDLNKVFMKYKAKVSVEEENEKFKINSERSYIEEPIKTNENTKELFPKDKPKQQIPIKEKPKKLPKQQSKQPIKQLIKQQAKEQAKEIGKEKTKELTKELHKEITNEHTKEELIEQEDLSMQDLKENPKEKTEESLEKTSEPPTKRKSIEQVISKKPSLFQNKIQSKKSLENTENLEKFNKKNSEIMNKTEENNTKTNDEVKKPEEEIKEQSPIKNDNALKKNSKEESPIKNDNALIQNSKELPIKNDSSVKKNPIENGKEYEEEIFEEEEVGGGLFD